MKKIDRMTGTIERDGTDTLTYNIQSPPNSPRLLPCERCGDVYQSRLGEAVMDDAMDTHEEAPMLAFVRVRPRPTTPTGRYDFAAARARRDAELTAAAVRHRADTAQLLRLFAAEIERGEHSESVLTIAQQLLTLRARTTGNAREHR